MTDRRKKFCPNCGDRIKHSTTRCSYCGQRVFPAGFLKYIIIAVVVTATVFLVLLFLNKSNAY